MFTLESCIFSGNTASSAANGGAVNTNSIGLPSSLTVLGCTFYNNTVYRGGAIYINGGTFSFTGNVFLGNTATAGGNVVFTSSGTITSGGYNVSDKAGNTDTLTGSGYTNATGDLFSQALLISPASFKPVMGGAAAGKLSSTLPEAYPAVDFSGQPITASGAAGAVQALTGGYYLDYGVNNGNFGQVSITPSPDGDGCYTSGTSVQLTATASGGIQPASAFSHWLVNGEDSGSTNPLTLSMNASKTVRAVFLRSITVNDPGDTAGSSSTVTLRYALTNAEDGDTITLPANGTITLTSSLPQITKSVTINGNGATLTQTVTPSMTSQLLRISGTGKAVKISRLHFKGGRVTGANGNDAALTNNFTTLTLESCIFNDNKTTISAGTLTFGGAVYTSNCGDLTVLGCTFYNNAAYTGGAIHCGGGKLTLMGNLFFGNTATQGNVVSTQTNSTALIVSAGYNVSNYSAGTNASTGSGYSIGTGDVFNVTDITFATSEDPSTTPSSGSDLKTLTSLPADFPTTYFNGAARTTPATAGAVAVTK